MFRILALLTDPKDSQAHVASALAHRLQRTSDHWSEVAAYPGFRLYCTGTQPAVNDVYPLHGGAGAVFGTVFTRDADETATAKRAAFGPAETDRILATQGRDLIASYWGSYVAFVRAPASGQTWAIRSPVGQLPCFYTRFRGITIFFSCLTDCLQLGLPPFEIDWDYVRQRVTAGALRSGSNTALKEVSAVFHGQCIELAGDRQSRSFYWNPMAIAREEPIEDASTAASLLRSTVRYCTHAWVSGHRRVLHRLSGGLDSSILLSCLADAPARPDVTCLTIYVPGEASDERPWARLAARSARCEHVEVATDFRIDLADLLLATPSVNPPRSFAFLLENPERELARARDATVSFDGDGGDCLFGAAATRFVVADYLSRHGLSRRLPRVALDMARCLNVSIWEVLASVLRDQLSTGARQSLQPSSARKREFLNASGAASEVPDRWLDHEWFRALDRNTRSAADLVAPLFLPSTFYCPMDQPNDRQLVHISPLWSQPVVETCIRIPSYVHTVGERSRGLARQAFTGDVPPEILQRRWKDRPPLWTDTVIFENNLNAIRDILLDGLLVQSGLLNRERIEKALAVDDFALTKSAMMELFDHMNIECWLRNAANLTQSAASRKYA